MPAACCSGASRRSSAGIGLTLRHLGALGHLSHRPDLSYSDLARRAGITTQSMHATVRALEDLGAVSRTLAGQGHPARLEITARGRELLRRSGPPRSASTGSCWADSPTSSAARSAPRSAPSRPRPASLTGRRGRALMCASVTPCGSDPSARLPSGAMTEDKVRVAVVFGGRSSEHAISCVSAGGVLSHLDRGAVRGRAGRHHPRRRLGAGHRRPRELVISDRALPSVDASGTALALPGDPTRGGLVVLDPDRAGEVFSGVDVVFPVLHGPFGEDGTIQGLLEMAGVPYVGAGVLASAAAMDKEFAKKLLAAEGLPVGDLVVLRRGTATLTPEQRDRLGLPVFVKPARAGSSVGITRVTDWADLDAAIATAREHDPKVLVEAAVVGPRGRVRRAGVPGRHGARQRARRRSGSSAPARTAASRSSTTSRPSTSTTSASSTSRPSSTTRWPSGCARWRWPRSGRWTGRAWPASTSSSARTAS